MNNTKFTVSCFVHECNKENKTQTEKVSQELKEILVNRFKDEGHSILKIQSEIQRSYNAGKLLIMVGILHEEPTSSPGKTIEELLSELQFVDMAKEKQPSYVFHVYTTYPFHTFMSNIEISPEGFIGQDKLYKSYVKDHKARLRFQSKFKSKTPITTDMIGRNAYVLEEYEKRLADLLLTNILTREEFETQLKDEVSIHECKRRIGLRKKKAWQGIAYRKVA